MSVSESLSSCLNGEKSRYDESMNECPPNKNHCLLSFTVSGAVQCYLHIHLHAVAVVTKNH